MKHFPLLILASFCLVTTTAPAADTAKARLFCLSLRFQRGVDRDGFYALDLTTIGSGNNGELAPDFSNSSYSHWSGLHLTDNLIGDELSGNLSLNVPDAGDANGNGWQDFFEVSQPVANLTSSGTYNIPGFGSGSVQATWSRPAGSPSGGCTLNFKLNALQSAILSHPFDLLEYNGPLAYTPGSNTVSGSVNLWQTNNPDNQLQGAIQFVKDPADRFNNLTLQPGGWTNSAGQSLTYTNDIFQRGLNYPTNYYGAIEFDDGDLNTGEPDYYTWFLSIDDPNDSNQNGIPNFSDDPQLGQPRRPSLSLMLTSTNLLLKISGEVGRLHQIQDVLSLDSTNWQNVLSLTLTNDPTTVPLALPAGATHFWRAQVQ